MGSVLATLATLAAIGLILALDPGGAIAESGFPGFRDMDWKQLTAWGFRTIGVGVGLLLMLSLWLKYRPPKGIKYPGSMGTVTRQPSELSAAAVSVLEEREVTDRTLLATIIEMCQRGTLQIDGIGTRSGYGYRLSQQGPTQFEWERLICDSLPFRPTTVRELRDRMKGHNDAIGDQLGEYLQRRGLFPDNPMRVRKEHDGDGVELAMLAGALMGVAGGLWLALWLSQWWANSLVGAFIGCTYWLIAAPMYTGMLAATQAGAYEIRQWLGLKETLSGPGPVDGRDESDSMLAHAIALDAAKPWLDEAVPAPSWFGSRGATSLQGPDLHVAYHGLLSAPEWGLTGRSEGAAEAAAGPSAGAEPEYFQLETPNTQQTERTADSEAGGGTVYQRAQTEGVTSETEARREVTPDPASSPLDYRKYRSRGQVEEPSRGRGCGGCFLWVVSLLGIVALVLAVLFGPNLVSPAVDPCPADSPRIPPHGQLLAILDLLLDECVSVAGEVVRIDVGELVVEIDRGEYLQRVRVRGPTEVLERVPLGQHVKVEGRIGEHEDGGYMVHFGEDRGWWGNLRENFLGGVFAP